LKAASWWATKYSCTRSRDASGDGAAGARTAPAANASSNIPPPATAAAGQPSDFASDPRGDAAPSAVTSIAILLPPVPGPTGRKGNGIVHRPATLAQGSHSKSADRPIPPPP